MDLSSLYFMDPRNRWPIPGLSQAQLPDAPESPSWINSLADLPEEERKRIKRQALMQAIGQGLLQFDSGKLGSGLLAGSLGMPQYEQEQMAAARERQAQEYAAKRKAYEDKLQEQEFRARQDRENQQQSALVGMFERLRSKLEPMGEVGQDLLQQAYTAAQNRDMAGLAKIESNMGPELRLRQAFLNNGVDYKDPLAIEAFKQKQAEEHAKRTAQNQAQAYASARQPSAERADPAPWTGPGGRLYDRTPNGLRPWIDPTTGQQGVEMPDFASQAYKALVSSQDPGIQLQMGDPKTAVPLIEQQADILRQMWLRFNGKGQGGGPAPGPLPGEGQFQNVQANGGDPRIAQVIAGIPPQVLTPQLLAEIATALGNGEDWRALREEVLRDVAGAMR